jgi:hypothetical protein
MNRLLSMMVGLAFLFAVSPVFAGTVETISGDKYSGVVTGFENDVVSFMWQKFKDQPEEIKTGDSDRLFQAQGQQAIAATFNMSELVSINGITPAAFQVLFSNNLYYKIIQMMEKGRVQVSSNGDFVSQIKAAVVLILVLGLLMPLLMMVAGKILPGEGVSFFGGVGLALVFTVAGIAAATGSAILTQGVVALGQAGAQYALSAAFIILYAFVTHLASSHSFVQGLGFSAIWCGLMALAARIAEVLITSGAVDKAIS